MTGMVTSRSKPRVFPWSSSSENIPSQVFVSTPWGSSEEKERNHVPAAIETWREEGPDQPVWATNLSGPMGHFLVPNTSSLSCVWSLYRKEKGSEGIQTDLSSVFSLEDESFGQPGEKTGHGLLPANRPATNNPGRDIPVPGGVRSDETGILLIDGNGCSKKERLYFW